MMFLLSPLMSVLRYRPLRKLVTFMSIYSMSLASVSLSIHHVSGSIPSTDWWHRHWLSSRGLLTLWAFPTVLVCIMSSSRPIRPPSSGLRVYHPKFLNVTGVSIYSSLRGQVLIVHNCTLDPELLLLEVSLLEYPVTIVPVLLPFLGTLETQFGKDTVSSIIHYLRGALYLLGRTSKSSV